MIARVDSRLSILLEKIVVGRGIKSIYRRSRRVSKTY
jgi:hypothetical protein